jgi:ATP-binding cassette subfamily B protein
VLVGMALHRADRAEDALRVEAADLKGLLAYLTSDGVNRLAQLPASSPLRSAMLKEFEQMQAVMKKMKGGGLMKMMKKLGGMKGLGGGKSTIANLISRFWDVSSGSITIGGVDVRDMAEDDLMRHVSFVFQDIFLFKQSILDNIRMGNPSASEEQVIAAAKAAQCHEFISKLPGGYHTVVGSKGIHLSGGERQRIAIARAIIKDSPIIVLDEATAFSDPENEYLIQKAFEKLMQGKTVIIIAHRLSTIRNADKIIVMEKGHLIEEGKHDELVDAGGRYAQMWNHYTEAIGWKISGKAV